MKDIIDDFDKGIGLDRNKIVAYRSSQSVIFSKEAGAGRNLAQIRDWMVFPVWINKSLLSGCFFSQCQEIRK